ncbi:MAG: molybdopterin-dependent oxidoreductase [Pseudomonadota bacterium]
MSEQVAVQRKRTFCRVCEPACGMIATVKNDQLIKLEADREHPVSKGFVCNKGIYGAEIHNDPDRLRHPLRRTANGDFERISWDTALTEISDRLKKTLTDHGSSALGFYGGNPGAFNALLGPSQGSLLMQLGVQKVFSSGTQDCSNKFAASKAVFGTRTLHPVPDIAHSDFILIIGENPAVSHMSFVSLPHPMQHLKDAEARGATVLYVNPRQIESASKAGRVRFIKPDTDVYLLAAMLHTIDAERGFHPSASERAVALNELRRFVADYPASRVASITGIPEDRIRELALALADANSACVHMSTGVNMGRQGTLAYWLVHMLSLVTGNLGSRGGNRYSTGFYTRATAAGRKMSEAFRDTPFGPVREPSNGITLPGNLLADYVLDPNDPIKAMFVSSGNPVLSIGGEARMRDALESLDLLVCIDIYRSATAEHADYVLPAAGAFEREDINITGLGLQSTPSIQYTPAIVSPGFERRPDWWIWEQLCAAMGFASAFDQSEAPDMWGRIDAMLRSRGTSMEELRDTEIMTFDAAEPEELFSHVQHDDGLIDAFPAFFSSAIERMREIYDELAAEPESQLKLITKRDAYMLNSWYANVDKLKRGDRDRNYLYMHPQDAEQRQLADGSSVRISNQHGTVETELRLSDELMPGVVAMTHGWGHQQTRGMRTAQQTPGVNPNRLLPSGRGSYEPLSNQAHMTGIAVDVRMTAP